MKANPQPFFQRIKEEHLLASPEEILSAVPSSIENLKRRYQFQEDVHNILQRKNQRKLLIVGPCSTHDKEATIEYGKKLKTLSDKVSDTFLIIMRTYVEKPRTIIGWKGLVNDPSLDGKSDLNLGYIKSREIIKAICELGLPTACEIIHPMSVLYLFDLLTWTCIGARTAESQVHREMASGLSTPVGFKNGTSGDLNVAINAMLAAKHPHALIGVNDSGKICQLHTTGNDMTHLILRGGASGTNYQKEAVHVAVEKMNNHGLVPNIMIDSCHGNSEKKTSRVPTVFRDIIDQIKMGNENIIGIMLESFLVKGRQDIPKDLTKLTYGQSVTDPCINWEMTESLILEAHDSLSFSS